MDDGHADSATRSPTSRWRWRPTEDKYLELPLRVKRLRSLTVVHLCDVDPAVAKADPSLEGRLNQHKVKTLDDVAAIVATGQF